MEVLWAFLLWVVTHFPDIFCQLDGFFQSRTGVAGHEVGNQILIHAILLVESEILIYKTVVDSISGLAHPVQNRIRHMFRGHF